MRTVLNALRVGGRLNRLKTLWHEGRAALGVIATIPSVQTVQIVARSGLDWILIDLWRQRRWNMVQLMPEPQAR
jgi:2-keto-3-deoxy-L-rhamnonate aldolase RhmA